MHAFRPWKTFLNGANCSWQPVTRGHEEISYFCFHIHIALAFISSVTSSLRRWRLMILLEPPMNSCPMNTAGTLGWHPSWSSSLSICCPFDIWSSSYTVGFAPKLHMSVLMEWLMQQVLLLKITAGFSATKLVTIAICPNKQTKGYWIYTTVKDLIRRWWSMVIVRSLSCHGGLFIVGARFSAVRCILSQDRITIRGNKRS